MLPTTAQAIASLYIGYKRQLLQLLLLSVALVVDVASTAVAIFLYCKTLWMLGCLGLGRRFCSKVKWTFVSTRREYNAIL